MNLLIKRLALFISLSTLFLACEDPQDIGKDLQPQNQNFGVLFTDTVTVKTSTVLVDSVRTSNSTYIVAGQYTDPLFGSVRSESYFQARLTDTVFTLAASPVPDSLVLFLDMEYSYGDTNQVQRLNVHQLSEFVQAKPFYSFDSLSYDNTPVGSIEFKAQPKKDTLKIKLADNIGTDLVGLAGISLTNFLDTFYGLALVPSATDNAAVLGFSIGTGSKLRLYYKGGTTPTNTFYDFPLNARGFNHVVNNRSNTPLATLQNRFDEIPASLTAEETFLQAGTGLMTKIEIPYIQKLKELGNVAINRAELVIEPVSGSISASTPVPPVLALYQRSTSGNVVRSSEGYLIPLFKGYNGSPPPPQIADYDLNKKSYTFSLNANAQRMLEGKENNSFYLAIPSITLNSLYPNSSTSYVLTPESLENTVNRLVIGSSQHPTHRIKLNIYYTLVR